MATTKIDDAMRYAARRRATYINRLRTQVFGGIQPEEEFNAEYDATCDKNVQGYITDHRGVWVKDDRMVLN